MLVDSLMHETIDIYGAGQFHVHSDINDNVTQSKIGKVLGVPHCILSEACARHLDDNNVKDMSFMQLKALPEVRSNVNDFQFYDPFRPWELVKVKCHLIKSYSKLHHLTIPF